MKKAWIAVVVVALVVGAGAFWAGTAYGESRAQSAVEDQMRERFAGRGGQGQGGGMPFMQRQGGAMQPSGGVRGTIEAIEGETVIVNSDEGIVRVMTTESTLIEQLMVVGVDDLEIGKMVIVMGSRNDDGTLSARSIQAVRAFQPAQQSGGQ